MKRTFAALLLGISMPFVAQAQEPAGRPHLYAVAGKFSPESNARLRNPSGQFAVAVGGGWRASRHFAVDLDLLWAEQRVDTPPGFTGGFLGSTSGRSTIDVTGLGVIVRAIAPLGNFEPYVGAGIGYYRSRLIVPRQFLVFFDDIEKTDSDGGFQFVAGLEYRFGRSAGLGFQYRKLDLDAAFGNEVPGKVKVGGSFYLLSLRASF